MLRMRTMQGYSLAQLVIVLCIVMVLWSVWLVRINTTETESNKVGFTMAANQFNETVHLAHVEWLRQAQPNKVELLSILETDSLNKKQFPSSQANSIDMTTSGWPKITVYSDLGCKQLWADLLNKSTKLITEKQRHFFQRINGVAACSYQYGKKTLTYFESNGEVIRKLTEENNGYAND